MFLFPSPHQAGYPTLVYNLLLFTTYPSRDHEKADALHSVNLAAPQPCAGCCREETLSGVDESTHQTIAVLEGCSPRLCDLSLLIEESFADSGHDSIQSTFFLVLPTRTSWPLMPLPVCGIS
jgi:hypothetical protein